MDKCFQCHSPILFDQKFCRQCGTRLADIMTALIPDDLIQSINACEEKISKDPRNPLLYMEFGDLFMEFGIHDKALIQYQKATALDNTSIDAFVKSGNVCLILGKFDSARIFFEDALKLKSDLTDARVGLFSALKGMGKLEDAVALGMEIIKAEPNLLFIRRSLRDIYLQKNEEDKVIRENVKILSLAPTDVDSYKQLAGICEKRKDFSLASDIYRKVLEIDPHDKDSLLFIGSISFQEGRYEESVEYLEALLLHDAGNITARIILSLAYIGMGSYDEATRILSSLPTRNLSLSDSDTTNLSRAFYLIGSCRLREGNLRDAKDHLVRSLEFRKTEAATRALAEVYSIEGDQAFSRKSYDKAKTFFQQALDLDANIVSLRDKLHQVHRRLELKSRTRLTAVILVTGCIVILSLFLLNFEPLNNQNAVSSLPTQKTAAAHYGETKSSDGSSMNIASDGVGLSVSPSALSQGNAVDAAKSDAHYNAGLKLIKAKRLQDAISEFQKAASYNPNNFNAYNLLGYSMLRNGDPGMALAVLRSAAKIPNSDLWCHYNLSLALLANNHDYEALNEINFIIRTDSSFKAIIRQDKQFRKYCKNINTLAEISRLTAA